MLSCRFSPEALAHESEGLDDLDISLTMIFTPDESMDASTSPDLRSLSAQDQGSIDDRDVTTDDAESLRDQKGKSVQRRASSPPTACTHVYSPYEHASPASPTSYSSPIASSSSPPLYSPSLSNFSPQSSSFLSQITNELTHGDFEADPFYSARFSTDPTGKNKGKSRGNSMDFGTGDHVLWGLGIPIAPPKLPNLNFSPPEVHYPLDWDNDYSTSYIETIHHVSYPSSMSERVSLTLSPLPTPSSEAPSSSSSSAQSASHAPVAASTSAPIESIVMPNITSPQDGPGTSSASAVTPARREDVNAGCVPWRTDKNKESLASKIKKRSRSLLTLRLDSSPNASVPATPCPTPSAELSHLNLRRPKALNRDSSYMYPAYPYNNPITVSPPRTLEPEISLEPEIALLNHFDNRLPRELKLGIFSTLVDSYEIEHARDIREGRWTTARAGKEKWVGRDAGLKELVKISRVSRAWQCLAFDGQLWSTVQSPRAFPSDLLARISLNAGPFVRVLDLSGCSRVNSAVLLQMTYNFSVHPDPVPVGHGKQVIPADYTNLTTINLQGCSITTYALHQLLTRSPCLKTLCLRGLGAVTNATCELLSDCCAKLVKLDLGRCANMDAGGVLRLAKASQEHGKKPLRELRISGLKRVSDTIMSALARGFPDLEVLDLAGCKDLTNASLKEFVAWSDGDFPVADRLTLTSREMGLDPGDPTKYHKRATKIRHLSISSCSLLTDMACTYLAHSLPLLEIFEFAGLGNAIQDEGLVRLLNTTPMIRKIDLEDAADITDAVLEILTPLPQPEVRRGGVVVPPLPQPGHALESLVVSYANNLTVDALTSLIRACPRLRTLEVDNTQVSDAVVREFVKQCRTRGTADAGISAIDCRGISRGVCTELKDRTRPRRGWRGWDAKKLFYVDAADETKVEQGQDECEPAKVLFKSFFSWQAVDTTLAARAKVRKALASRRDSAGAEGGAGAGSREGGSRSRWLSPFSSRRSSGSNTPASEVPSPWEEDGRGCIVM